MYAALPNERFPIPAARIDLVDPQYWRQIVPDPTGERPGTIVVKRRASVLGAPQVEQHVARPAVMPGHRPIGR